MKVINTYIVETLEGHGVLYECENDWILNFEYLGSTETTFINEAEARKLINQPA